jgi:CheY-like chemotaxis protein
MPPSTSGAASSIGLETGLPVLLVGCDTPDHMYLKTRLSLRRLDVREVATAAQAIEHCAEHVVTLVFVDGDAVGPQAPALCRQLATPHACRRAPGVVLMGGPGQTLTLRLRASLAGCRWLPKPLHPRDLDAAILKGLGVLADRAGEREIVSLFQ